MVQRKIKVIGTMHHMLPKYREELEILLEKINPDQLLVEIDKKDLDSKLIETYPKEMIFAYRWAIKNKKQIGFFDVDMDLWKEGVTQKDEDKIEKEWFKKYGKKDWKFFNQSFKEKREIIWTIDSLIDQNKMRIRQEKMLKNINEFLIENGKILILTGAYHLDFFRKNLEKAKFLD